jgi:hypothetical protein
MPVSLEEIRELRFMRTRIPALDALEIFIPTGHEADPEVDELIARTGNCRWYPEEGGHRVLILYESGEFDAARFTLKKGGWDHEHCAHCGAHIEPMTLSWVTESGRFILLDDECHEKAFSHG